MRLPFPRIVALTVVCSVVTACTGGSTAPAVPSAVTGSSSSSAAAAAIAIDVTVPAARVASSARRTQATAAQTLQVVSGTSVIATIALTSANPACVKDTVGDLVCSQTVSVAAGTHVLAWTMLGGTGNTIGSGTVNAVVSANQTTTIAVTLAADGTVAATSGIGPVAGSPIAHVIVVIMENRTFDNLFNGFPGSDTVASGATHDGGVVALQPRPFELPPDPSHERSSLLTEYDNGKMDGFDLDPVGSTIAGPPNLPSPSTYVYGYVPQAETLPYWTLAKANALADRMFASQLAPSYPGHQYLIAGQSGRAIGDPVDSANPIASLQTNAVWGCDSPAGSTVELLDANNNDVLPGPFPCFDYQTLGDKLDAAGVSWHYYTGFSNGVDLDGQVSAYDAIKHIRYGTDWTANVISPEYRFFGDVAAGTLPAVTWITPPAVASDHAGSMNSTGPSWVAAIANAVAASPYAANTAIFVTWDDSGGWYDHVAPPQFNGLELGFRVPLIAISAYAKHGYISHAQHDYGSILHFIEKNFGAASLGTVDARADDLSDMFDYTQAAAAPAAVSAPFSISDIQAIKGTFPIDDDH